MSIDMLGKPPENTAYDQLPYFYYIGTKEKDGEDYVDYKEGTKKLSKAINLWYLVDEVRAK